MKKRVLVTGANGQLGKTIQEMAPDYSTHIDFVFVSKDDLDISNKDELFRFFKKNSFDYCVNCAAYTAVDKAEAEEEKAYQINAIGVKNLALACKEHNTVLIHISTDFVFDGNKTEPYREDDETNPISMYGASKLQGEKEIKSLLETYFIIRTSWLYSEHGHNFVKTMLQLAKTRDEISVVNDQTGSPTYAGDLAKVIIRIINTKSKEYGIYHYSNEGNISWYDFAKAIFELSRSNVKLNAIKTSDYLTAAKRPKHSVLNKTKIKTNLNIIIENWKDSLSKALNTLGKN